MWKANFTTAMQATIVGPLHAAVAAGEGGAGRLISLMRTTSGSQGALGNPIVRSGGDAAGAVPAAQDGGWADAKRLVPVERWSTRTVPEFPFPFLRAALLRVSA